MRALQLSLAALMCASCATLSAGVPAEPGRYCRVDELVGDTGISTFPLGQFIMVAELSRAPGGYSVSFHSSMPDSQQILAASAPARVAANGVLVFDFEDGWGNAGRGRLSRRGVMTLEITRLSEDVSGRNIGRNYGTFELSRGDCSHPAVSNFRFDR